MSVKPVVFLTALAIAVAGCKNEAPKAEQTPPRAESPPAQAPASPARPAEEQKPEERPKAAEQPKTAEAAEQPKAGERPKPVESRRVLARGTKVKVRTTAPLSTKTNKVGDSFTATIEEPLVSDGRTIASRGAIVTGRVVEADPGGRVKKRARIGVQLTRIEMPGGRRIQIATNTVHREAPATKAKDAKKVGVGAGIGAIVGAVAGGGKGAGIGAAAGAGAGSGAVLATRGDPAAIPAETVLVFTIREQTPAF